MVGDFNYVFDPSVALERYFDGGKRKHVVLVDEAHNLVDRSREMYSASLTSSQLMIPASASGGKGSGKACAALAKARSAIDRVCRFAGEPSLPPKGYHRSAIAVSDLPKELISVLKMAKAELEAFLMSGLDPAIQTPWLEAFFELARFITVSEMFDETYRVIADPESQRTLLLCLDPSRRLSETVANLRSVIFFSATLSPLEYFVELLGGESTDAAITFDSPFDAKQMRITIAPFDVSYQGRENSLTAVATTIGDHLRASPGNHLIFCPSFGYLEGMHKKLSDLGIQAHRQNPAMTDQGKQEFLKKFVKGTGSVGLAVLGGIFSEGIDLPGSQLIGVTVIGIGLPGMSIERDLLADYFVKKERNGFDYAYRLPGMQRVRQAVGRLIRTEEDSGDVFLIDKRYQQRRTQALFPAWWIAVLPSGRLDN